MPTAPPPTDPVVPPRPAPARAPGELLAAWLTWFGLTRLVLGAVSVAVVASGAFWLLRTPTPDPAAGLPVADPTGAPVTATLPPPVTAPTSTSPTGPVLVHVAGAVVAPGVYEVPVGARVDAAVSAAGGIATHGDADALNLAAPLADGQRIYVPAVGEVDPADLLVPAAGPAGPAGTAAPLGPVDLNTAEVPDLERLPGVGPATAAAIIDDRTRNGPFASVDDLDRVPGIGPAKLAALRDLVTV
jgi:competence protein ComEA